MKHLFLLTNIINTCIQMMPSLTCNDKIHIVLWECEKTGKALCSEKITYSH